MNAMLRKILRALLLALAALVVLLVVALRLGLLSQRSSEYIGRQPVRLARVSDGDTVVLLSPGGEELKVRLAGIDTSELGSADGFRAALFTAELLEGARKIELETEPAHRTSKHRIGPLRDKYGRLLGWVWVTPAQGDTLLLQEQLLRRGLARLYTDEPHGKLYYERLNRAAR